MSKIGVGVGEDFPVDDGKSAAAAGPEPQRGPGDDGYAEYAARREAYRRWHEQRREWKRQWRDEWHARRREFRDQFRGSYYDGYGRDNGGRAYMAWGHPGIWSTGLLWRILAAVAVIAAVVFVFNHIYFILGALVVMVLVAAAFRHGFDPFDLPPRDFARRERRPNPSAERPAPPPAPTDTPN
ncbi:MAG: hypothetical protein WDM91_12570 [Rhizomicrobium sp.]